MSVKILSQTADQLRGKTIHFVNLRQMSEDIKAWSSELPDDLVAVAGIPRSGILPAAQLALHRNIHLITLDDLKAGKQPWRSELRRGVPAKQDGCVLIVDDSIDSGDTLHETWKELRASGDFLYGALYFKDEKHASMADFTYKSVPAPRCFEWNLFHCQQMSYACVDLDGVICDDWIDREADDGPGLVRYLDHVQHAKPKFLPKSFPVRAIVTARLEKYRRQTEDWLDRHGVQYNELIMSPHASASQRRAARDNVRHKANAYMRYEDARLFIESDLGQARDIAAETGRPVLCVQTMEVY